jgi:hypothetical protein
MLTGFTKPRNAELPPCERRFNYLHSITRGVVERAFGILKARFRWMLRGIHLRKIVDYAKWFKVSCILHNMCIDSGDSVVAVPPAQRGDGVSDDSFEGLAGNATFTAEVRAALSKRTEEAIKQSRYGTGANMSRKSAVAAGSSAAAGAVAPVDVGEEPEPTFEQDTRAARDVMIDAPEGVVLRDVIFRGLGIKGATGKKMRTASSN